MKWIIPVEILMESDLTWQTVVFLIMVYVDGLALFVYLLLCVIQKAKIVFRSKPRSVGS